MPTNQQSILILPREILVQILLLLPFKSITVCRLVSKEFNNLANDPILLNHISLTFFSLPNVVYFVSTKINTAISSGIYPPLEVNRIPIDLKHNDYIDELLSEPSKGIVCVIAGRRRLLFYNLLTGSSYPTTDLPRYAAWSIYGFGYDPYADDCKMVLVRMHYDGCFFWVYSLRNRTWNSFEGFPYAADKWSFFKARACSMNGVLHWAIGRRSGDIEYQTILTYDLHTCRFGEISFPAAYVGDFPEVGEVGGRLCYCSRSSNGTLLTMWTMREYGVSESWTRFLCIDLRRLISLHPLIDASRILYECQNGRKVMLFVCQHFRTVYLYWYDIDNNYLVTCGAYT